MQTFHQFLTESFSFNKLVLAARYNPNGIKEKHLDDLTNRASGLSENHKYHAISQFFYHEPLMHKFAEDSDPFIRSEAAHYTTSTKVHNKLKNDPDINVQSVVADKTKSRAILNHMLKNSVHPSVKRHAEWRLKYTENTLED